MSTGAASPASSPEGPAEAPLSIEPALGWRVWRLVRRDGRLVLGSVVHDAEWPPQEAMQARCTRHRGGPTPGTRCQCGLYAASSLESLAKASVFRDDTCVVGAIAMWGTIVEHARGFRSGYAYPARLRLVCGICLRRGRGAVEPAVVVETGSQQALCKAHARDVVGPRRPADEVQSELLSTYAVDLLAIERARRRLRTRPLRLFNGPIDLARLLILLVGGLVRIVIGFMVLSWIVGAVLVVAGLVLGAVDGVIHRSDTPPAVISASPPTPTTALPRPLRRVGPRSHHPVVIPHSTLVCGDLVDGRFRFASCKVGEVGAPGAPIPAPRRHRTRSRPAWRKEERRMEIGEPKRVRGSGSAHGCWHRTGTATLRR